MKMTDLTWKASSFLLLLALVFTSCGDDHKYAIIETPHGEMKVKLYNTTPEHRDNFIKLAEEGYYDSLLFHRVIPGFMIQGGDPDSRDAAPGKPLGAGGPGYKIGAEINHYHFKGTLAAARQGDNVNPDKESSGSQFYIVQGQQVPRARLEQIASAKGITYSEEDMERYENTGGTPGLDNEYTVFGEVVEGLEVIDRIAAQPTNQRDRPVEDIRMKIRVQ